jgi:hypothetical protein
MVGIGILAGLFGLCLVPMLLKIFFGEKEILNFILPPVVAIAVLLCARIINNSFYGGVVLLYIIVILISFCTSGPLHARKDGGTDHRFSHNPYYEGLFSGAMWRAIIAIVITLIYQGITSGDWGPLGIISGFFGGFFYELFKMFKILFN